MHKLHRGRRAIAIAALTAVLALTGVVTVIEQGATTISDSAHELVAARTKGRAWA